MTPRRLLDRPSRLRAALALFLALSWAPAPALADGVPGDPWEGFNRAIFKFNDTLDVWILEPVAKGWDFVVPDPAQRGLDRFFDNLRFPIVFVNSVLQANPTRAGIALGRFSINTTLGMAGFFDPAAHAGLTPIDEDFGQTLGRWGVGGGPYLVLPFFGPSNPRDGVGMAVDSAMRVWPWFVDREISFGVTALNLVNTRSLWIDLIADAKEESLDYYAAVRDAYLQRRRSLIENRDTGNENDDSLYFPHAGGEPSAPSEQNDDDLYFPDDE